MSTKIKKVISTQVLVASLEKKANPAIKKLKKIVTVDSVEEFQEAGIQLKVIKAVRKEAADEMSSMLSGIKLTEKKIREHFKPFFDKVDSLEADYKLLMSVFLEQSKKKQAKLNEDFETNKVKKISTYNNKLASMTVTHVKGGASIRKVQKLFIVDEKKIPREYLVPNEKKIREALEAGENVPGCELKYVEGISI